MSFAVVVPDSILDEIVGWELPAETEEAMLDRLHQDLEYGHETTCFRLSAPSPTFVYQLDLPHPFLPVVFLFTFHLTYGEADNTLYVRDARVEQRDPSELREEPEDENE